MITEEMSPVCWGTNPNIDFREYMIQAITYNMKNCYSLGH